MGKPKRRYVSVDEQKILEHLQVRVLTSKKEIARCDDLIVQHHYLHDATLVGEQLRYVASYQGEWLAVATWSAPPVGNAMPPIFTSSMTPPSRSGCGNWSKKPVSNCGRRNFRPSGRWWKTKRPRAAGRPSGTSAACGSRCAPNCRSSGGCK